MNCPYQTGSPTVPLAWGGAAPYSRARTSPITRAGTPATIA